MYQTKLGLGDGPGKVLGGEGVLWTHQVDGANLDAKVSVR